MLPRLALALLILHTLSAEPCAPLLPLDRGVCFAQINEWPAAETAFLEYTASHAADPHGWDWLAQSRFHQKKFDSAKESIQHALALDSRAPASFRTLGEIELELHNYDAAYRAWLQADKLKPGDARTTYYLGRLFFEADFLNEAAAWFRETLKAEPRHFAAMTYLGMCAERLNMQKTAFRLYEAAIRESKRQNKPFSWAFVADAKLLRQTGREKEAIDILEEAEKTCPEAHVLTLLGQMLSSETLLRRAIAMDPTIPDPHYTLALLLRKSGQGAASAAEMQKFQEAKDAASRNKTMIQAIRKTP